MATSTREEALKYSHSLCRVCGGDGNLGAEGVCEVCHGSGEVPILDAIEWWGEDILPYNRIAPPDVAKE